MVEVTFLFKVIIQEGEKLTVFYQTEDINEYTEKIIECHKMHKSAKIKCRTSFNNYKGLYFNFQITSYFIIKENEYDC